MSSDLTDSFSFEMVELDRHGTERLRLADENEKEQRRLAEENEKELERLIQGGYTLGEALTELVPQLHDYTLKEHLMLELFGQSPLGEALSELLPQLQDCTLKELLTVHLFGSEQKLASVVKK